MKSTSAYVRDRQRERETKKRVLSRRLSMSCNSVWLPHCIDGRRVPLVPRLNERATASTHTPCARAHVAPALVYAGSLVTIRISVDGLRITDPRTYAAKIKIECQDVNVSTVYPYMATQRERKSLHHLCAVELGISGCLECHK